MLVLLSPSKTQDFESARRPGRATEPRFHAEAADLVAGLRALTVKELARSLGTSEAIARATHDRYRLWGHERETRSRWALYAYTGEAFRGLDARTLTARDVEWAQKRLRILSALYGVLRPLDRIEPYRLDFTASVRAADGESLTVFWRDRVTAALAEEAPDDGSRVLVNLASHEYSRIVDVARLGCAVVTPRFCEPGPRGLRTVSVRAKNARGRMARWIVERRIRDPRLLVGFAEDDYRYRDELSSETQPVFVREASPPV